MRANKFEPLRDWEDDYEINRLGCVRSIDRYKDVNSFGSTHRRFYRGKPLKPVKNARGGGYWYYNLYSQGRQEYPFVERLVARQFIPSYNPKTKVMFRDGNTKNWNVSNLYISNIRARR